MRALWIALCAILLLGAVASAQQITNQSSGSGGVGTVTSVTCNAGITGGTFTTTGTCALDLSHANTWSAAQTFTNSDLLLLGSSTGATTLSSANAGASNFTITFPAATDTVALLGTAQTFTAAKSFNSGDLLLKGASSGTITLNAAAAAGSSTLTLPGGTTDFSSTGGTSQVVKQVSAGAPLTVARLACSDLSDSSTGCSGAASATGANPSASVGTAAVNGSAATFLRSDGAPAIDQTMSPTWTGVHAFGEVHGATETVVLSSNNYNAVVADCGKTKLLPTGTTPTVTLPNISPASGSCTIVFMTTAAKSYLFNFASGGAKQNSQGFYNTRGTAAGDTVMVTLVTPSVSAALWNISGDVTS